MPYNKKPSVVLYIAVLALAVGSHQRVRAANDWLVPCIQGQCSWDLPADSGASGSLKIVRVFPHAPTYILIFSRARSRAPAPRSQTSPTRPGGGSRTATRLRRRRTSSSCAQTETRTAITSSRAVRWIPSFGCLTACVSLIRPSASSALTTLTSFSAVRCPLRA
jgi:hypothetical protein